MKKRLSLFFALILILSVLPVYAAADGDAPSPAEEALRLAIKNGETEYTLYDDLTLSADLIIPVKFTLTVDEDTLDAGSFECPECGEVIDFENAAVEEVVFDDEDDEDEKD